MSCKATIKSPITGKTVMSTTYFQLTNLFDKEKAVDIYNSMYSPGFQDLLGFDWTSNKQYREELNLNGEPKIEYLNKILDLQLSDYQIDAINSQEDILTQLDPMQDFATYQEAKTAAANFNLNPRYKNVSAEVERTDSGFRISVGINKYPGPESKETLSALNFGEIISQYFPSSNTSWNDVVSGLLTSDRISNTQKTILSKLQELQSINPSIKLVVFDDTESMDAGQVAFYDNTSRTIYIGKTISESMDDSKLIRDVIHETMHAYTIKALNEPVTDQEKAFKAEMEKAYNSYLNKFPNLVSNYGFANVEEFVSEVVSNPDFRAALKTQQEFLRQDKNFLQNMLEKITNFLKGLYTEVPNVEEIDSIINDYLDHLIETKDMPLTQGEYDLRFRNEKYNPSGTTDLEKFPELQKFVDFVNKNSSTKMWGQITQSLKEIDATMRSTGKLQERFSDINATNAKDILANTISYLNTAFSTLSTVQNQLSLYKKNAEEFEDFAIIKTFNYAKNLSAVIKEQINEFEKEFNSIFNVEDITDMQERADTIEAFEMSVPDYAETVKEILSAVEETRKLVDSIDSNYNNTVIAPIARELASSFGENAIADGKKKIQEQLAALTAAKAKADAQNKTTLSNSLARDIEDLKKLEKFIPTAKNIEELLKNEKKYGRETSFLGMWINNAVQGKNPTVQIVKQYIDKATAEAQVNSGTFSKRAQDIFDRLRALRGKLSTEISTYQSLYKGFTREVEVLHKQPDGSYKKVKQAVLNTKLKEEEFQNDLKLLLQREQDALKTGNQSAIDSTKAATNKFLEDYAMRPYTDEYYKIQDLLTEEAKEAREAILAEISFLSEDPNPEEGTKDEIKRLLTEFNRLGSLYYSNGDEKPEGSKDRRIAESIIAWKKERNNQDVLTYDNVTKRKQWQIQKNEIDEKFTKILKRKNALDIAVSMSGFAELPDPTLAEQSEAINKEYDAAKQERDKWYEENTRTEIAPEFFERQQNITESINAILSRYPTLDAEDLTDAYKRLNNAVLGFRDNDGTIQGNDVTNAGNLFETIKKIEEEIEAIKKYGQAREINKDDQEELARLYKMLNALQGRKETQYYKDKVNEIKANLRTELAQDSEFMDGLEEKAKARREQYIAAQLMNTFTTVEEVKQAIIEEELDDRFRASQWYKDNHVITEETRMVGGETITTTKERPSYIWTQVLPKDPRFIIEESPSFQWSIPTIDDKFKNKEYRFTTEPRPRVTEDGKYSNPEYYKLPAEERAILDDIITLHEDVQRQLPKSQRVGYAIINENKSAFEAVSTVLRKPLDTFVGIYELFKVAFLPNVGSAQYEQMSDSEIEMIGGRKAQMVRSRYKTPLNTNQVSYNILGNIAKFGVYSSHFAAMQRIMPAVFSAREALERNKTAKSTLSTVDFEISKNFYGEEINSMGNNEYVKFLTRPLNKFLSVGQRKALQFNAIASVKNFAVNLWNVGINKNLAGVSRAEFIQGMWRGIKQSDKMFEVYRGGGNVSYYADLLMHFNAMPQAQPGAKADTIHQTMLNRFVSSETAGFLVRGYLESISTIAVFESIMNQYNVQIEEGGTTRTIKLSEAYKQVGGKLQLKAGVKVKNIDRLEQEIRDRVFNYFTSSQGNYYKRGSAQYERYIIARMVMSMKRWLATTFNNKYGSRRLQLNTGNIEKGFNREVMSYAKLLVLGGTSIANQATTDQQKSRSRTAATNLVAMLAIQQALVTTMGILAKSLDGDDEEETSPFLAFMANILQGIHDELSTFSPIGAANWAYKSFYQTPQKQPGESDTVAKAKQLGWSLIGGTTKASFDALTPFFDGDTWSDPFGDFTYRYTNGLPNSFSTPEALKGKSNLLAAFMVYTGAETGMSQFLQPEKKLYTVLKYNPRLDVTEERRIKLDPMGSYNQLSERVTEIKKELKSVVPSEQITDPKERQQKIIEIISAQRVMREIGQQYPYVGAYYRNRKFASSLGSKEAARLNKEIERVEMQTNPEEFIQEKINSKRESFKNKMGIERLRRK